MIIIYQTYQDKVNQCGESGLSVLLTQSWLDITPRICFHRSRYVYVAKYEKIVLDR